MNPARHGDIALLFAALLLMLVVYWPTALSMEDIWSRSQTFAHGFLVLPLSGWLIWRQRPRLALLPRSPSLTALALLAAVGAGWMMARIAHVQILQQYGLIALLACTVAAMLGKPITHAIAFPLAFLFLAVPFGETFIPPLMDFTAAFVTAALRTVGIPVFRDNHNFSLPSGNWSVVEACSGLRYMIATLALGMLFAHLNYHRWHARLRFMALALTVPVAANGLRAFLIVLLGHWSDMRLATGIDHLLYGWLFFGTVMLLLFWLGGRWREPAKALPMPPPSNHAAPSGAPLLMTFGASCALILFYPWVAERLDAPAPKNCTALATPQVLPAPPGWYATSLSARDWRPLHRGCYRYAEARYLSGAGNATLHITSYRQQYQDADLLTAVTREREPGMPLWREMPSVRRTVSTGQGDIQVQETDVQSEAGKLLAWRWYIQSGHASSTKEIVKLRLALSKLSGGPQAGAEIVLTAPYEDRPAAAAPTLQALLTAIQPMLNTELPDAGH